MVLLFINHQSLIEVTPTTTIAPMMTTERPTPTPTPPLEMTDANVVLQVNRSHLDRMADFLATNYPRGGGGDGDGDGDDCGEGGIVVRIVSTRRSTASKSCSLLLLRVCSSDDAVAGNENENENDNEGEGDALSEFMEDMTKRFEYLLRGLNKVYVMAGAGRGGSMVFGGRIASTREEERGGGRGEIATGHDDDDRDGDACVDRRLLAVLRRLRHDDGEFHDDDGGGDGASDDAKRAVVARVDVFPMGLQRSVVSNLTALLDAESIPEGELDISPSNYTHSLSVVQLDAKTNDVKNEKMGVRGTFLVGVAPLKLSAPIIYPASSSSSDDDDVICRSYRKLAEAFERYRGGRRFHRDVAGRLPPFPFLRDSSARSGSKRRSNDRGDSPLIAIDCGSAPGGWTKYLSERTDCDSIYSIDPGDMDPRVSSIPKVHHLKMTSADAVPHLRDALSASSTGGGGDDVISERATVVLWVGDMCTHEATGQVDALLRFRESGMVRHDAAFVLTVKCCNVGHGRARHDEFAEREAGRLRDRAGAYGVEVMHLFSNRMSERTIVGFVK
jgi:hypothetical protein